MKVLVLIFLVVSMASACSHTKLWEGNNQPGHLRARFEGLSGRQKLKIKIPEKPDFLLKYNISVDQGDLSVRLKSSSHIFIDKSFNGKAIDSVIVHNSNDKYYLLILEGKNVSGSFDIICDTL